MLNSHILKHQWLKIRNLKVFTGGILWESLREIKNYQRNQFRINSHHLRVIWNHKIIERQGENSETNKRDRENTKQLWDV